MSSSLLIFTLSSVALAGALCYDIFQAGFTKLNGIVLIAAVSTGFFAWVAKRFDIRTSAFVLIMVPVVLYKPLAVIGYTPTATLETILVVGVLFAGLIHCTDVARSIGEE